MLLQIVCRTEITVRYCAVLNFFRLHLIDMLSDPFNTIACQFFCGARNLDLNILNKLQSLMSVQLKDRYEAMSDVMRKVKLSNDQELVQSEPQSHN